MAMEKALIPELDWIGQWKSPVLGCALWFEWVRAKSFSEMKLQVQPHRGELFIIDGHQIYYKKDWHPIIERAYQAGKIKDAAFFKRFYRLSEKASRNLVAFSEQFESKKQKENVNELVLEFLKLFCELVSVWTIIFPIADGVEKALNEQARENNISSETLAVLCLPERVNLTLKQQDECRGFAKELSKNGLLSLLSEKNGETILSLIQKKDKKLEKKIRLHFKRFQWVGIHYFWGEPLTYEKLFAQIQELTKPKIVSKKPRVPQSMLFAITAMQQLAYYRLSFPDAGNKALFHALPLFASFSRQHGFDEKDFAWFTHQELKEIVNGQKP